MASIIECSADAVETGPEDLLVDLSVFELVVLLVLQLRLFSLHL